MSRLEKLQIQGFRSFSPDDRDPGPQKIDFVRRTAGGLGAVGTTTGSSGLGNPLTLILGQNGCGKTTIIECLRYITTGDCPPGSYNGRNFVHDPKIANEPTVFGTVKMQFTGVDGSRYVVTRSMEATQKAKNITVKTLDATITRKDPDNPGQMASLSMKCADINQQMFLYLGVSKPILNYVIFCHQEDSNWPLEEGKKVKDKFDEIFDSAKYTDLLKKIKEVRSKHMDQDKLDRKDMEFYADIKRQCSERKKQLKVKVAAQTEMEDEVKAIEEQMKPVLDELRKIQELERNFSGIERKRTQAMTSVSHVRKEIAELTSSIANVIPSATVTDAELESMKGRLDEGQAAIKRQVRDLESRLAEASVRSQRFDADGKRVASQLGECRAHLLKKQAADEELRMGLEEAARALDWPKTSGFEGRDQAEECVENVLDTLRSKESELAALRADFDQRLARCAEVSGKLEIKVAQVEEQKRLRSQTVNDMERELVDVGRELRELDESGRKLEAVSAKLADKEAALRRLTADFDLEDQKLNLESLFAETKECEAEVSELRQTRARLEGYRQKLSEISIKSADMKEKESAMEKLLSKRLPQLKVLFEGDGGDGPRRGSSTEATTTSTLKSRFLMAKEDLVAEMRQLNEDCNRLRLDLRNRAESKKSALSDISAKEDRIQAHKRRLIGLGIRDVDSELALVKDQVEEARKDLEAKQANKFTFQEFIEKLEGNSHRGSSLAFSQKPACPTCHRHFDKASEVEDLKQELQDEIRRIPSKVRSLETKLRLAQEKLETLTSLMPEKAQADEMETSIADKQAWLKNMAEETEALDVEFAIKEERLDHINSKVTLCEELRDDIFSIDRYHKEVDALKGQVESLEKSIPAEASGGNSRFGSFEEVARKERDLDKRLSGLRKELEVTRTSVYGHEAKVAALEREKNGVLTEKLELERKRHSLAAREARKAELEETVRTGREELKILGCKVKDALEDLERAEAEKRKVADAKESEVGRKRASVEAIRALHAKLGSILDRIIEYERSRNDARLESLEAEQQDLEERRKKVEEDRVQVEKDRRELEQKLGNRDRERRNLDDNLRLRSYRNEEDKYSKVVRELDQQLENTDYRKVAKSKEELAVRLEGLERGKNRLNGRLAELSDTLDEIRQELDSDRLKGADGRYRKKSVEVACRRHVIVDLNKYYSALEWAIMRFHQERMSVINRIIRELWRATYRGNDIDFIEIEAEDADVTAGADKKKNYNYRVVMVKNDARLDMRGRCSAGQKVLASLIIRLALAETFSSNCGMIALDEPTTNLDRDNIESLALALSDIVSKRSVQKNFQLIVISHDDDLIDHLARMDQVDHYYKVSRNEKGRSIIRRIYNSSR